MSHTTLPSSAYTKPSSSIVSPFSTTFITSSQSAFTDTNPVRNNALQIRNLSPSITYAQRDKLLYGLAATSVHNYPHYTIAYFANESTCFTVIRLLHQRFWSLPADDDHDGTSRNNRIRKRIRVEFLLPHQSESKRLPAHIPCDASLREVIRKEQQQVTSRLSLSQQHPKSHNFPPATVSVIKRIAKQLFTNVKLYHQTLLLMCALGLDPPFDQDNDDDEQLLKQQIPLPSKRPLEEEDVEVENEKKRKNINGVDDDNLLASGESEIETTFYEDVHQQSTTPIKKRKRKRHKKLKVGIVGEKSFNKKVDDQSDRRSRSRELTTTIEEVFDGLPTKVVALNNRSKFLKIELKEQQVSSKFPDIETNKNDVDVVDDDRIGQFGQLDPSTTTTKEFNNEQQQQNQPLISFDLATLTSADLLTDTQLASSLLPRDQWHKYPVFNGYTSGERSSRLYVKNLHPRKVKLRELYCLYGKFIELYNEQHLNSFNIVYMDKGRMKGQAFITFPTEMMAEEALRRTNGYLMHDKPIVVSFARSQKAKPTDE